MLNPFPELLTYGLLAPLCIRLGVGVVLLSSAYIHWNRRLEIAPLLEPLIGKISKWTGWYFAAIEVVAALMLIAGFFTQIAALIAIALCLKSLLLRPHLRSLAPFSRAAYVLIGLMALSLMVSGAGAFAFDIRL